MSALGRPRQVEDEAVFDAMAKVLLRVGWARMTTGQVATEVGVTPAALRQRFGAKRELFAAFYAWHTERLESGRDEPSREGSVLDALRAMARESVGFIETPEQMRHAMSPLIEFEDDPAIARMTRARLASAVKRTTALLERAAANGEITCADPGALAKQLQNCLVGTSLVWSFDADRPIVDEAMDMVEQVLAPYLGTEGDPA
ncbi:TetR/AcrR family transcriptional regulator [Amycolatopsis sp. CA-230715]|uniref:TetR/AcrR family transcriptional regulator n=1 Tax=Amycolatopsis sp. CA-230715 TaxID=2745196 RepID=UPI001C00B9A5|nr:TetR/AcrR family transcriptional regulator [Amycolatopsis sp. CA-230715]QWF83295.1 hypothetical protein HUW46_06735 [Amycolatopsis sp. CA-230715]